MEGKRAIKRITDFTEGNIFKKMLIFMLPLLGTRLLQQLYNTVDIYFAGNFIEGYQAMSAIGASGMVVTLLVGFFNGISVGSGVAVSQAYGAHDDERVSRVVHSAVGISFIGGILISVIGFFLSPYILQLMNTPADIFNMAVSYIKIYFLSVLSLVVYNICTGILRAVGDSKSPLIYQCVGGLLNVVLDYIFTVYFKMGVTGIAVATLFSQTVPAICVLLQLMLTKHSYRVSIKNINIRLDVLVSILKVGVPAGIQSIVITLSNIIVQSQINSFGSDVIAAFTAYYKVELIMYMPITAFGQAITTFVAQNVGAGKYDRVSKGVNICLLMGIGVSVLTSGFVIIFARQCFAFFNKDLAVISYGLEIIYINAALYFLYNFLEIYSGAVRGAGNSLVPMVIVVGNMCGVRIIALFAALSISHTAGAVAVCYPITWFVTSVILAVYYYFGSLGRRIRDYKSGKLLV